PATAQPTPSSCGSCHVSYDRPSASSSPTTLVFRTPFSPRTSTSRRGNATGSGMLASAAHTTRVCGVAASIPQTTGVPARVPATNDHSFAASDDVDGRPYGFTRPSRKCATISLPVASENTTDALSNSYSNTGPQL